MTKNSFSQFFMFSVMGGITFLCDALMFFSAWNLLGFPPLEVRIAVLPFSMTISWWLNRRYTFKSNRSPSFEEWGRFLIVNGLGALINAVVFAFLTYYTGVAIPVIFLIAVFAALMVNFTGSKYLVFVSSHNM